MWEKTVVDISMLDSCSSVLFSFLYFVVFKQKMQRNNAWLCLTGHFLSKIIEIANS